jgi:glycosyltransferase involved in cell wall biosynthesis
MGCVVAADPVRPLVSVCITTFQHEDYIARCIESVLEQRGDFELEVIVGDDGSRDATRRIIAGFGRDKKVRTVLHGVQHGPSGNLQALVRIARGDFVAHLDGDDYWLPGKLESQLRRLHSDDAAVAVYTNARVVAPDGRPLGSFNVGLPAQIDSKELLRRGNVLCHSSLLYRRCAIGAVTDMVAPFIDYRVHVRLLARGQLAYLDEPLVAYRWRSPGSMIRTLPAAVRDGHLDAFREALDVGLDPRLVRASAARFWGKALIQAALGGRFGELGPLARDLRSLGIAGLGHGWVARQSMLAPFRAVASVVARRRGVYFP